MSFQHKQKRSLTLKREIEYIAKTIDHPKLRAKGVFLIGIPGTGKSYSAKCCAGELNRWLMEINLSKILEDEKPIELTFRRNFALILSFSKERYSARRKPFLTIRM